MEEESKNETIIENKEVINQEQTNVNVEVTVDTVDTNNASHAQAAKREYTFDSPEVREESNLNFYNYLVIRRITNQFNIDVVNNFKQRQEELSELLDIVRSDMYEVKMSIEAISEEVASSKQNRFVNNSQVTSKNVMNATIKKSKICF